MRIIIKHVSTTLSARTDSMEKDSRIKSPADNVPSNYIQIHRNQTDLEISL